MNNSVAIIGLGYVGLPLAIIFANKGFRVTGIDLNEQKLSAIRAGHSYLSDLSDETVRTVVEQKQFIVTNNYDSIDTADIIIICVPTPLTAQHKPDLSYLEQVAKSLRKHLRRGQLIVLESSTYPGTTKEMLTPLLESDDLKAGEDINIAYSPERLDPGSKQYALERIPKIVSGVTKQCAERVIDVYSRVFDQVVPVSSTEAAEFAKLLENSYRFVNISFINEMAVICDMMNIDVWETIEAAGTKPYGFSVFYPGPGVGGHCIPIDPLYLQWKLKFYGLDSKLIETSQCVNDYMPQYVVERVKDLMIDQSISEKNILVIGVTYKRDVEDVRESSAVTIMNLLETEGARLSYHDSYVPKLFVNGSLYQSVELNELRLRQADCVILTTDHSYLSLPFILDHASIVYDTRNMTKGLSGKAMVIRLGASKLSSFKKGESV